MSENITKSSSTAEEPRDALSVERLFAFLNDLQPNESKSNAERFESPPKQEPTE